MNTIKTFFGAQGLGGGATRTRGLSIAFGLLFAVATAIGPQSVLAYIIAPNYGGTQNFATDPTNYASAWDTTWQAPETEGVSEINLWLGYSTGTTTVGMTFGLYEAPDVRLYYQGARIATGTVSDILGPTPAGTPVTFSPAVNLTAGNYYHLVPDYTSLPDSNVFISHNSTDIDPLNGYRFCRWSTQACLTGGGGFSGDYDNGNNDVPMAYNGGIPVVDTTERIIDYTPVNGSVEPSTSVLLSADVFNQTSSYIRYTFQNFDFSGSVPSVTLTLPAVSGEISTSTTVTLAQGYYFGTIQMLRSDFTVVDTSNFTFTVVQSSLNNFSSYATSTDIASTTVGTCSASSTVGGFFSPLINFFCFMVVPSPASFAQFSTLGDTLQTKVPFAYFYDIRAAVSSSTASAASSTLGTFTLTVGTTTDPLNFSVVLFSPDTIRYFIPDSTAQALQFILLASLWVGFGWYMYNRVRHLLAEKTK